MIAIPILRPSVSFVNTDILNGLVAWYKLNGDATDSTGNNSSGSIMNLPIFVTGQDTVPFHAMGFTGLLSQYVYCGTNVGLSGNTNFTFSVWFNITVTTQHGCLIKIGNSTAGSGGDGFGIGIGGSGTTGYETIGNNIVALFESVRWIDTGVVAGTGWHHVVLVISSAGYPTVYFDGIQIYTDTTGVASVIGSAGTSMTQIGGYLSSTSTNRYFTGIIDDARFYNRPLSSDEIAALFKDGAK